MAIISFWVEFEFSDLEDFSVIGKTVTLGCYACRVYPVDVAGGPTEGGGGHLADNGTQQRLKFKVEAFQFDRYAVVDTPPDGQDMGDYLDFMDGRRDYNYFRLSDSNCLAFTQFPGRFALPRPYPSVVTATIELEPDDDQAVDFVTIEMAESELYQGS